MNYKRKKSKKQVKCTMCTDGRQGNSLKEWTGRSSTIIKKLKVAKLSQGEQTKELL